MNPWRRPLLDVPRTVALRREDADVETSSEGYASRFGGEVGRYFLEVQTAIALEMLVPYPGAGVLDVGGGHGQLAVPLVEHGFDVTVAGSSEICRERLDRLLPEDRFAFQACDLLRLPFADRSFDVVIAFRLIAHVERWRELVRELCRVAERAVILDYSDVRSFNLLYGPFFRLKKAIEGNTRTFLTFRPGQVAAELGRHGFGRLETRRQFFFPMVVHRAVGRAGFSRGVERVSGLCGLSRAFGSPVILRAERKEAR
ncbi:MAG TPA: class I SAM-dependent methyltransferase [Thermoanaerobaculia bacterium]|nr:class I SAM-dependent methyltransferase [Thermoanaerobaculia bacterium]